jgi:hypothetical protein
MKKVSKKHLEQIQELNKKQIDIKIQLGETSIVKSNIDEKVDMLLKDSRKVGEEMQTLSGELKDKYGDCQIDVVTGEILEQPSSTNVEKDDNKGDS